MGRNHGADAEEEEEEEEAGLEAEVEAKKTNRTEPKVSSLSYSMLWCAAFIFLGHAYSSQVNDRSRDNGTKYC
jgi:hypothetical protein